MKELVGSVIREWREERLKISEEAFAERYNISDRFVRMIQNGEHLPSSMQLIGMVMDMDWKSVGKLMIGFKRIKRQTKSRREGKPVFLFNESA